ncbi:MULTISPECIES: helix-turn-helix transcriptional regulator [unclassified Micromonospora]|uniref:helix-turn-helix domain-containing protein n=1 Tax=unclassified Micromonospora TaxID=2617518 RepID=UPI0027E2E99F|nr:helix-turn-helix transcriptional regulator [Micromonospora sp. RL09-050-HVF-A]
MGSEELPVGRRVARWRVRRRMTQQMLADRLGKSKSWVDKVERGVRTLDRYSVIQEIAEVLRVDPAVLLGTRLPSAGGTGVDGVDGLRAALARYDVTVGVVSPAELRRHVGHAWLTYQHAHYAQVLRALPGLLDAARSRHSTAPEGAAEALVQTYRIASAVLVKLGEADLGWLAADRAVAVAGDDPVLAGTAAVAVGQALRALGRGRLALAVAVAAARRVAPRPVRDAPAGRQALCGTLLLQAALAAAEHGDTHRADELIDLTAGIATRAGSGDDPHRICFGPVAVELARVVAAIEVGDGGEAVYRHEQVVRREGWQLLPAEYRAAYLVDAARAYLQVGDLFGAGRVLVDADGIAPAEVRCRPAARAVIAEIARGRPTVAGVARLATLVGLTTR